MTPQPPHEQQHSPIQPVSALIREQDKIQLVLAYLGCLCLVPLLTVKDSPFVQWHAKQGLVLNIGVGLLLSVLSPYVWFLGCLGFPALAVVDIVAIVRSLRGERWRIPLVADLADKF